MIIINNLFILFAIFECIFEGLGMLENLPNFAHISEVAKIAISYRSHDWVWQICSPAPPTNKNQPLSFTYTAEIW